MRPAVEAVRPERVFERSTHRGSAVRSRRTDVLQHREPRRRGTCSSDGRRRPHDLQRRLQQSGQSSEPVGNAGLSSIASPCRAQRRPRHVVVQEESQKERSLAARQFLQSMQWLLREARVLVRRRRAQSRASTDRRLRLRPRVTGSWRSAFAHAAASTAAARVRRTVAPAASRCPAPGEPDRVAAPAACRSARSGRFSMQCSTSAINVASL